MKIARCACGEVWQQHGNQSGHCATCHISFSSNVAFDMHRRAPVDGQARCIHPSKVVNKKGEPQLVERTDRLGTVQWGRPGSRPVPA